MIPTSNKVAHPFLARAHKLLHRTVIICRVAIIPASTFLNRSNDHSPIAREDRRHHENKEYRLDNLVLNHVVTNRVLIV